MGMDYYLLQVNRETERATTATGAPRKGYVRIQFIDICDGGKPQQELYDLRGLSRHHQKFRNWANREFSYLRFDLDFG